VTEAVVEIVAIFVTVAWAAIVPGLNVIALAGFGLGAGTRSLIAAVAGAVLGYIICMAVVLFAGSFVPLIFETPAANYLIWSLKLAASAALGYSAFACWRASTITGQRTDHASLSFLAQVAILLSEPALILFFLPQVSAFNRQATNVLTSIAVMAATLLAAALVVGAYAALASRIRVLVLSKLGPKNTYRIAAGLIAWAGIGALVR
jgi:threonine/homoserine/homoserine lactone efflux protein